MLCAYFEINEEVIKQANNEYNIRTRREDNEYNGESLFAQ